MKKEYMAALAVTVVTLVASLLILRWFAPGLLGIRTDLQMVQVAKEVPPFYQNVFRKEAAADDFSINDPIVRTRSMPWFPDEQAMGPNDLLGFRNRMIPAVADVITIGDSQTYGNNSRMDENWPAKLQRHLAAKEAVIYNMSAGGWGALQYLDMAKHALAFQPKVIIVAYYTGNDAVDSFSLAYSSEYWREFRLDPELKGNELPKVTFPAPKEESWPVNFQDGCSTIFTPKLRMAANDDAFAGVGVGYAIMIKSAETIAQMAAVAGVQVIFTIIPTKEYAYRAKLQADGILPEPAYASLVTAEKRHIRLFEQRLNSIQGGRYVDVVGSMQQRLLDGQMLYREDDNGHPVNAGYAVIADVLHRSVDEFLPTPPRGLYARMRSAGEFELYLVSREGYWLVGSEDILEKNGWLPGAVKSLTQRELANLPYNGHLDEIDPSRFGPKALTK